MESKRGNIFVIGLVVLLLISISVGGYLFWQNQKLPQVSPQPQPTNIPTALTDKTSSWKTFTNSTYGYSVKAPTDFTLKLCSDCNPPEVGFALSNPSRSINIGFDYAAQGSLTGNARAGEYSPVNNPDFVIQSKEYKPEEYYDTVTKSYVFDISSILNNGVDEQIRASGQYKNEADRQLVSQILSSFTYLNQAIIQKSISVSMIAQNNTGESGTATITGAGEGVTSVDIRLNNVPGGGQSAFIVQGSCSNPGSIKYNLADIVNGMKTNLTAGGSVTILNTSLENIRAAFPLAIVVRYSPNSPPPTTYLSSCGELK